jgi:hypothetical protein
LLLLLLLLLVVVVKRNIQKENTATGRQNNAGTYHGTPRQHNNTQKHLLKK